MPDRRRTGSAHPHPGAGAVSGRRIVPAADVARLIAYWSQPGTPEGEAVRHLLNDRWAVAEAAYLAARESLGAGPPTPGTIGEHVMREVLAEVVGSPTPGAAS